jgi:hypothetical protein
MARRRLNTWHGAAALTEDVCWLGPAERPPRTAQGGREQTARGTRERRVGGKGNEINCERMSAEKEGAKQRDVQRRNMD